MGKNSAPARRQRRAVSKEEKTKYSSHVKQITDSQRRVSWLVRFYLEGPVVSIRKEKNNTLKTEETLL